MAVNYTDPSVDGSGGAAADWWTLNAPPDPSLNLVRRDGAGPTAASAKPSAQAFIANWQQTHAANEGIGPLADALTAAGYTNVSRYMYGTTPSNNELSIDGQKFKVLSAENSSNPAWYTPGTNDGGGSGSIYGSLDGTPPQPWQVPTWQGGPPPDAAPLAQYHLPTQAELEATPGYQARMAMGEQAIQRSAAAQGNLQSGGTLKALARYGQDYASNEYANLVGQGQSTTSLNNSSTQTGNQNAFQIYMARYGQFADAANLSLTGYNTNVNTQRNSQNDWFTHLNDLYQTGANTANNSYKPGVQTA